jgi:hypothetical protein
MSKIKLIIDFFRLWIHWGDRKEAWQDAKMINDITFQEEMKEFDTDSFEETFINKHMSKEEAKDELIKVLYSQVMDLTMMSKIELGDDVIAEIKRLRGIIEMDVKEQQIEVIKLAHQQYVDWWLPIDVAAGSTMGAMSCHRFCESLLTFEGGYAGGIKNWWNEWLGDYTSIEDKTKMKVLILKLIISHYTGIIDLNKK